MGSTLMGMGNDPQGGFLRFRVSPPTAIDDTRVILTPPDGQSIVLHGNDLNYGRDYGSDDDTRPAMDVFLRSRDPSKEPWPKIRSAMIEGGKLRVKLERHGQTLQEVTFDFSDREARDALLTKARRKIAAADPNVCTDKPPPARVVN